MADYAYCHNDPVNKVDALGLATISLDWHGLSSMPEGSRMARMITMISGTEGMIKIAENNVGEPIWMSEEAYWAQNSQQLQKQFEEENALAISLARQLVKYNVEKQIRDLRFMMGQDDGKNIDEVVRAVFYLQYELNRNGHEVPEELTRWSQSLSNARHDLKVIALGASYLEWALPSKVITMPFKGLVKATRLIVGSGRVVRAGTTSKTMSLVEDNLIQMLRKQKRIPESSRMLPPSAKKVWIWDDKTKIAGVNALDGKMKANPKVWSRLTPGQKSTIFWEEMSHRSRILGQPMWKRKVNWWLYDNTSLGKFTEEAIARTSATRSLLLGLEYGWNYKGVNKGAVIFQGSSVIVGGSAAGYYGADAIWGN